MKLFSVLVVQVNIAFFLTLKILMDLQLAVKFTLLIVLTVLKFLNFLFKLPDKPALE